MIISSFAYTYDNSDRRTRVDLADTGRWQYSYDSAGQVTGGTRYGPKLSDNTEAVLAQYGYQYDPMGNPTQRSEDAAVSAYTFNNLNQLVAGSWSGTLSTFGWTKPVNLAGVSVTADEQTQAATVFKKGEWTAKGLQVAAGDTTLTVTRAASDNSTVTAQTSVTRPADGVAFTHDLNGNMLTDGRWTYTWDEENRLASAVSTSAGMKLTFVYDALGRRRVQREYTWATDHPGAPEPGEGGWSLITDHSYVWDGWLLVRELRTSGGVTRSLTYLHGLDLAVRVACAGEDAMATAGGIGGILALTVSAPSAPDTRPLALFFYDGNGNVVDLADSITGTTAAHYEYGPFGNVTVAAGPLAETNRIRFSTKEEDATGLHYYGLRYYNPDNARWLSRDPLGDDAQVQRMTRSPLQMILFREHAVRFAFPFVENAPTVFVDGVGLMKTKAEKCEIVIFYGHGITMQNQLAGGNVQAAPCSNMTAVTCESRAHLDPSYIPSSSSSPFPSVPGYSIILPNVLPGAIGTDRDIEWGVVPAAARTSGADVIDSAGNPILGLNGLPRKSAAFLMSLNLLAARVHAPTLCGASCCCPKVRVVPVALTSGRPSYRTEVYDCSTRTWSSLNPTTVGSLPTTLPSGFTAVN